MAYTPMTSYKIGTIAAGSAALSYVEVTGPPDYAAPKFNFKPYSKPVVMGDGTVRGAGWATAEWTWDVMTRTQRDWLRTFIPGQSAEVFIYTKTFDNSDAYVLYRGVAIWPVESEEHDATRRVKFTIKFQRLIAVPTDG